MPTATRLPLPREFRHSEIGSGIESADATCRVNPERLSDCALSGSTKPQRAHMIAVRKGQRLFDYQPKYDIFRMIDDALACRAGQATGVIPTHAGEKMTR